MRTSVVFPLRFHMLYMISRYNIKIELEDVPHLMDLRPQKMMYYNEVSVLGYQIVD